MQPRCEWSTEASSHKWNPIWIERTWCLGEVHALKDRKSPLSYIDLT